MALVLVVDDETAILEIAREMLESAGHTVLEATNGKSGLWIFCNLDPDLAVVDLFMPEKDGIETIQEMRAANPDAKIIAISGGGRFGIFGLLDSIEELGASGSLAKPFCGNQLRDAVEQALNN